MSKTIYEERGISVQDDGKILLMRCPKCDTENYAPNVISGVCTWCGYNAHKDMELKERINSKIKANEIHD